MVYFKDFLQLKLQEGMLIDIRGADTLLAVFVVDVHYCSVEFVRNTTADLSIKCFMRLRRAELARDNLTCVFVHRSWLPLLRTSNGSTHAWGSDCDTLLEQLFDHDTKLFIVSDQLVELVLVQITTYRLVHLHIVVSGGVCAKSCCHLLHLLLKCLEACVSVHFKLCLQLFVVLLQLVEVSRLVRVSLQQADHVVIDRAKLLIR